MYSNWKFLVAFILFISSSAFGQPVAEFEQFCQMEFGAEKEPMIYDKVGNTLEINLEGIWVHPSRNSAAIGWDCNLPVHSYVEYGVDSEYDQRTEPEARYFYVNLHYLKNLQPATTYHYRLVSTDERGNTVTSRDATFTTLPDSGMVTLPGTISAPYVLDQANTVYILESDLVIDGRAIQIEAENITLDLNGHSITYNNTPMADLGTDFWDYIHNSAFGVYIHGFDGTKILNGTIKQGAGQNAAESGSSIGFNPIYAKGISGVEIAGLTIEYGGTQMVGIHCHWSDGPANIHHNIFMDTETIIDNRHGWACRALNLDANQVGDVHHNLVKRTRQNGLHGKFIYNNEVYVDSWSTNSFAIAPVGDGPRVYNNRVFGTGFNPYGYVWASTDAKYYDNIVHFVGQDVAERWIHMEDWGDINMLCGMRVTNYSGGGQVRNGLEYYENLIVIRGSEDCEIRGVEFYSDESITDLTFHDNIIKTEGLDEQTNRVACVVGQGYYTKPNSIPIIYANNTFISNRHHVTFGDAYGRGHNHHFFNCTFISSGATHPDASTFMFGGGYWSYGHIIRDCLFGDDTAADYVRWGRTLTDSSSYRVEWTLTIQAPEGASVKIEDSNRSLVYQGVVSDGEVHVPLVQYQLWAPEGHSANDYQEGSGMLGATKLTSTPHIVTVTNTDSSEETRSVNMIEPTTEVFFLASGTFLEENINSDPKILTISSFEGKCIIRRNNFFPSMSSTNTLNIYDISGKLVEQLNENNGEFIWRTGGVRNGIYLMRLPGNQNYPNQKFALFK